MNLVLDNISKSYPGRKVLDSISLEIRQGDKLVITGPNGSGKSTLLNIIASLLPASKGKVTLTMDSIQVSGPDIMLFAGVVSPDLYLYDELTANENLRFFAKIAGIRRNNYDDDFDAYGLAGRGDDLVGSFSSGMKQRLKYVLALLKKPPLLLLDEPSANLDDSGKSIVYDLIKNHDGITVIATNERSEISYGSQTIELGR